MRMTRQLPEQKQDFDRPKPIEKNDDCEGGDDPRFLFCCEQMVL